MAIKPAFDDREDIINALKEEMNIATVNDYDRGVTYVKKTNTLLVNNPVERELETAKELEEKAKREAEEALNRQKLSEEELFAKLLEQKRS